MFDWSSIIAAIIGATTTLLTVYISKKSNKEACPVFDSVDAARNIYKILDKLQKNTDSDRVYIYQFHNGGKYFSGLPRQRMSCTYEIVSEGVSTECEHVKDLRCSIYSLFIERIMKENGTIINQIDDIKHSASRQLFLNKGVHKACLIPIYTKLNNIVGIIGIDYIKAESILDKDWEEKSQKDVCFMKDACRAIAGYLIK
jgi:hypothetical protein